MLLIELFEGLEKNDLDFMISDTISVDQYKGKFTDDSVVVVLFIKDEKAAIELEDFIQKFPSKYILLTEVNLNQDKNNYFQLFIDFKKEKGFITELLKMLEDINKITNIKHWKMKIGKNKFTYLVNEENLLKFIDFN